MNIIKNCNQWLLVIVMFFSFGMADADEISFLSVTPSTVESTADPAHPYAHPYYWAPFILMGNWL